MVSKLDDPAKARYKFKLLRSYLKEELQLPLREKASPASAETFAAFMGLMRSCNPLHASPKCKRALPVECPFVVRWPEVLTGKLSWYKDVHVPINEIIDVNGDRMNAKKMWRLLVWIFLGSGGRLHMAWNGLKRMPCVASYKEGDKKQPLEVLRFVIRSVYTSGGSLMRVFGGDGLDKKSRLAKARILYIVKWHAAVPGLVIAFRQGPQAFHDALLQVPGLRGELSRKEVLILFAQSEFPSFQHVGEALLPFGQGARNGAKAFLGVRMSEDTQHYHKELQKKIPNIEKAMHRLFPVLPKKMTRVTLGDVEPCLCAAFVYAGLVSRLRAKLGKHYKRTTREEAWKAVTSMKGPAGFYAYDRKGRPELGDDDMPLEKIPYKELRLRTVPPAKLLTKSSLLKAWGPGSCKRRRAC